MFLFAIFVSVVGMVLYFSVKRKFSPPLDSNKKFLQKIPLGSGNMFDQIAPYYDNANKLMSMGFDQSWRKMLVDELNIKVDDIILGN